MATLRVWKSFEVQIGGITYRGGSRSDPIELDVTQGVPKSFTLAATTTRTLWTGSTDELASFDFFWIEADGTLRVELVVDTGNEVGDEKWGLILAANNPFDLMQDDALAAYTSLSSSTADVIDKIQVRNPGSSEIKVFAFMAL